MASFVQRAAPEKPRVAIIGAGISGLVEAYELTKKGFHVDLFEASNRCGGRIQSISNPFGEGGHFDIGAEIIDRSHTGMIALCKEFNIPLIDRHEVMKGSTLLTAHGQRFTDEEMLDAATGKGAYAALAQAIEADKRLLRDDKGNWTEHARQLDLLTLDQYLAQKAQETGTPHAVVDIIKTAYTSEIGRDPQQLSALNMIDFIGTDEKQGFSIFGDSDESYVVQGGTERIVNELRKRLEGKVTIHHGHRLSRIDALENGAKQLTFTQPDGSEVQGAFDVVAPAIPLPALAQVQGIEHLGLSPSQVETMRGLQYNQLTKVMLQTKGRPWETMSGMSGEVIAGGSTFQVAWPSAGELTADTRAENGTITMLVGGNAAALPPAELVQRCKDEYAALLGKSASDVFTEQKGWVMQHWKSGGCYPAPQPGSYVPLTELSRELGANKNLLLAGSYVTMPSDHGTWVGFMHNASSSAQHVAERVAEMMPQIEAEKTAALDQGVRNL